MILAIAPTWVYFFYLFSAFGWVPSQMYPTMSSCMQAQLAASAYTLTMSCQVTRP